MNDIWHIPEWMVLMNDIFIITLQFIIYDTSMYASIKNLLAKLLLLYILNVFT